MGKKRDKANANIELLIDELIDARKEALGGGNCPHYGVCPPDNSSDCSECRKRYFESMRNELMEEYTVR